MENPAAVAGFFAHLEAVVVFAGTVCSDLGKTFDDASNVVILMIHAHFDRLAVG